MCRNEGIKKSGTGIPMPDLNLKFLRDLGFQTTAGAFQTEKSEAEQSNGRATFRNCAAVSRS